jgi:Smr domain.
MNSGIVEIDIHGLDKVQAKTYIDLVLKKTSHSVYKLRVIHGYHGGTELKNMIRGVYKNHPKVKRIEFGLNQGETDLVLRELF